MDTHPRPTDRPPAALLAAAAGILALVILAPALLGTGSLSASGLSPQLADAPPGLVELAFQAGTMTGIDPNVLLTIAKVETDWGRARNAQPDELVPADIRAAIATRPRSRRAAPPRTCSACPTAAASATGSTRSRSAPSTTWA